METLSFTFMTDWFQDAVELLMTNAVVVITSGLVLVALVVGAFWLLGLAKKGVKQAK